MYLYLLNEKAEALDAFKSFKGEVERQKEKNTKIFRSDIGVEYYATYIKSGQAIGSFAELLNGEGIVAQHIMPSTVG